MSNQRFVFSREDLLKERSLWDVYKIARLTPANGFNVAVTLIVFFVCIVYCIFVGTDQYVVLGLLRQTTTDAIAFSTSILGFLVAGFTICVSSKSEIFFEMAKVERDDTGVSYLKYNLSIFLLVFIHYLAFTVLCVSIRVFFASGGPGGVFLRSIPVSSESLGLIRSVGISLVFVGFVTWFFYILMLLKSFIFNVYHIVMTGIALTIDD
ncbi:hypothetical protein [Burkholderia gladioli]|uniref:hypothetical protein n=1 Tax=Burkholderia gladioli TaxID=28095 RepID=UPI0012D2CABA|nr:hypothetical protein [Burkholderia gladioli]